MNRDERADRRAEHRALPKGALAPHVPLALAALMLTSAWLWIVVRRPDRFPLMLMPLGLGAFATGACVRSWCDRRASRRTK